MSTLIQNKIEVRKSPIHGYGVFASEDIKNGDILEECYFLKLDDYGNRVQDLPKEIREYVFQWPGGPNSPNHRPVIAIGYGSVYNHRREPSAVYIADEQRNLLVFSAIQDIKKGDEIFVSYGDEAYFNRVTYTPQE